MNLLKLLLTSIAFVSLIHLYCTPTDGGGNIVQGGSGTETIGIFVDSKGKPVAAAYVNIVSVTDSTARYADTTNDTGAFRIDTTKPGQYYLSGFTKDTSLVAFDTIVKKKDTTLNLGKIVMKEPGAISGRVTVDGQNTYGVHIYIPGSSFSAWSDTAGAFLMTGVFNGVYTLHYSNPKYATVILAGVTVISNDTLELDTIINLLPDTAEPPPAPKRVSADYDTASGIVTLHWQKSSVADLKEYLLYKTDSTGTPQLVGVTSDTVFTDTIIFNQSDTTADTLVYQVKSRDNENNPSPTFSPKCAVSIVPPCFVKTTFTWVLMPDTIITGKDTMLAVKFANRTRINKFIRWYVRGPDTLETQDTVNSKTGTVSLRYSWKDTGYHYVWVEALDCKKHIWRDSCKVNLKKGIIDTPDTWKALRPLIHPRRLLSAAVLNNTLYTAGGVTTLGISRDRGEQSVAYTESFNFKDTAWNDLKKVDTARHSASLSAVGDSLYLIGGIYTGVNGNKVFTSVMKYTAQSNTWSVAGNMPWIRFGHAACVIHDTIYVFGGYTLDSTNTTVIISRIDAFDPNTKTWTYKGEMRYPRVNHQAVYVNNAVYILGGQTDESTVLSSVEKYDPVTQTSSQIAYMSSPRVNFGAVAIHDTIFVFGGVSSVTEPVVLKEVEAYSISTSMWIDRKDMKKPLYGFGTCVVSGKVYLIGGCEKIGSQPGQVGTFYKYIP